MTGSEIAQAAGAFFIVCTVLMVILIKTAKPGWQDSDGFHAGHEHSDFDGE